MNNNELLYSVHIRRQPTTIDNVIPKDSCNPLQQKQAALRYLVNRLDTYPSNESETRDG